MARYDILTLGSPGGRSLKRNYDVQGVTELVISNSHLPFSVSVGGRIVSGLIDLPLLVVDWDDLSWTAYPGLRSLRLSLSRGATRALSPRLSGVGWSRK
jgi:hypothetical protein